MEHIQGAEYVKEWVLDAESEYRFELDPKTTLAIKVCIVTLQGNK